MLKELTSLQRLVLAGLAGLILLSAGAVALSRSRALPPSAAPPPAVRGAPAKPLTVTVTGAVARPGLYTLPRGARAWDAVQAAGGLSPTANVGKLNLARPLKNGAEVHIRDQALPLSRTLPPHPRTASPTSLRAPARSVPAPPAPSAPTPPVAVAVVSLHTASAAQLAAVPGLNKLLASAIVKYRTSHGAFDKLDELLFVPGLTPPILAQARPYLVP
jgi:competence protein ComEA